MEIKYTKNDVLDILCSGCDKQIDEESAEKGVNVCQYC